MKVLIVADVVGGVRTFVAELAHGLSARGADVNLALIGGSRFEPPEGVRSCELRDLRLEWMRDPWADVAATGDWIEDLRLRHRPDVIHMNTFAPVGATGVPVLLTVHSCVLTWWRAVHGEAAPNSWQRYEGLARNAFDRAAVVSAPTRALLDELAAVYGELPPARVIPNGRAVAPAPVPRQDHLVVAAGRLWDPAKNAALTARAAGAIDGRVVLIGPGEVSGVECVGALPDQEVVRWFARASVYVEPARYEPFGLAALEAALSGCALGLGDIPSLREVWGDAAAFVAPDDADGLAHAVNRMLADPAHRRRAAAAAGARAARYTRAAMAGAYLSAYRRFAPGPPRQFACAPLPA
jgi:glycogen synthase